MHDSVKSLNDNIRRLGVRKPIVVANAPRPGVKDTFALKVEAVNAALRAMIARLRAQRKAAK